MAEFTWLDQQGKLITNQKINNHFIGMIVYCNDGSPEGPRSVRYNDYILHSEMWTTLAPNHPDVKRLKTMMLLEGVDL